ncbi:MAG: hypothetical protein CM15mP12_4680 [Gammaproteobacteria bacterium]|nr:MAG: hypothetical protein CM15mP12_4680 [Gammaproteobacteria bacterium]
MGLGKHFYINDYAVLIGLITKEKKVIDEKSI